MTDNQRIDKVQEKLKIFREEYTKQLTKAITEHPDQYCYGIDLVSGVVDKMMIAISTNNFNNEGAFTKTILKLTGKSSRKALYLWLGEES